MSNIVYLAARKPDPQAETDAETTDFDTIAQRNARKQEKLKRERALANQAVLRSYRIKS